jgi:aspartate/methionine/tyrosine aminotransferase
MHSKTRRTSSQRASQFKESVIREMSRLAAQHGAVNLSQGLPDFPCPPELKEAASKAVFDNINQYAITWGDRHFRQAIADKMMRDYSMSVDPETEITVTCGATEAMVSAMLALVDPGEEVVVFEPFYENYGPDAILSGATPRYVSLHAPEWRFDEKELERAFNNKTRAIIVNSPHNPTGVVFDKEQMQAIARLCQKWGVLAITDEIYEHILFDGNKHIVLATVPGMEDLTITINSLSKTFSVTGWRVGWAIAKPELTSAIRKVHDFLTVGAPAPLQRAGTAALKLGQKFYDDLSHEYEERREHMLETLQEVDIPYFTPQGAYYVFSDISGFGHASDLAITKYLVEKVGVAVVPGSVFFGPNEPTASRYVRFCFSRKMETLQAARERILKAKLHA